MANINSFAENMRQVVTSQANTLSMLAAVQKSMTSKDMYVTYDYTTKDGSTTQYQIPSYTSIVNKLNSVQSSLESLNEGRGTVALDDGTHREIKLDTVADAPPKIVNVASPTTFSIDANWFFENFMYPSAVVTIDLTGQVEDSADRCKVKRIILDSRDSSAAALWANTLSGASYTYAQLISMLALNNVGYYEDEETIEFPLVNASGHGEFIVKSDPESINGNIWYTFDTLSYSTVSNDGVEQGANNILSVGDLLSFNETVFKIVEINQNENKVRIQHKSGVSTPGLNSILSWYEDPFRSKQLKVHFGAHEYDIIYFKGVQETYNLLSVEWSTPVMFETDSLIYDESADTTFAQYYVNNIVD